MAKIINLNKFRKSKAKETAEKQADTNRRLHGRTNAERQRERKQKEQLARLLDGSRLSKTDDDDSES